jgi:nucleoside triphosphate pyrophosphatase
MSEQIILASASPRRLDLLQQIGVNCRVYPVDIDETPNLNETPLTYVERVAAQKSLVCQQQLAAKIPVLAADTAVVLNGRIMGKPLDFAHAQEMLRALSGKTHQVFSGVSVRGCHNDYKVSITEVTFRTLDDVEIAAYWQTGEPADKAGGYAIQGMGGVFVESIRGSFSGVVGLPLFETAQLLKKHGIKIIT